MMRKKYGIREYVIWLTLVPLLAMAISFGTFFLNDRSAGMERDLFTRGHLIASQMAASSEYGVFSNNLAFLNSVAAGVLQQPDVIAAVVLNADFRILVAAGEMPTAVTRPGKVGDTGIDPDKTMSMLKPEQLPELVSSDVPVLDRGDILLLYQPILSTQIAIEEVEAKTAVKQVGAVIIEMSWSQTRKLQSRLLRFTILATAVFLLVTLTIVHHAGLRITQPISKLSVAIQDIGDGDLESRVSVPNSINELSTLTNGINQMKADLRHERTILQRRIDEATRQLQHLAFYDTLTQLPNRRLLMDRLTQTLAASKRSGRYGALMFIDMDNFKPVNDQFGHSVGDLLLIEVARRIRGCLRDVDTVARFGGDEFVVILSELSADHAESVNQANIVAEKIREVLGENYYMIRKQEDLPEKTLECHCTSSIGVALFLGNDVDQEDIMRWADSAMYQAKQDGRNLIHFNNQIEA
jgi:diguanylate cyclase (GGDEF)-like protein